MKSDLQDQGATQEKIDRTKKHLELQILETEALSAALESPNHHRIRALEGHDPTEEELHHRLTTLESLEGKHRELIRQKAIAIKEITKRCDDLQDESNNWKASTQMYLKDINDIQGRLHEVQRIHMAQMSELTMYASLVDKLTMSKTDLENDISFRAPLSCQPKRDAILSSVTPKRKQLDQRPTAYLPIGDDIDIIRVPRPFGRNAPFKAINPGSTMRHIRKPQPVPLLHPN
jgi:hypothetical protein